MKNEFSWGTALFILCRSLVCQAAPPPNDNFADRIALSGNDVVFTGTLAGATFEVDPGSGTAERSCASYVPTVWWSWTATQRSPVILELLDSAPRGFRKCFTVWPPPNPDEGFPWSTNSNAPRTQPLVEVELGLARMYTIFIATNGITYNLQLAGSLEVTNSFRFRLTASVNPVIKEQPLSLTILSNASALFKVQGVGVPPLSYQWQF